MGNVIDAYVYDGRAETKPLYQYDYGQILKFYKLTLPEAYEVHFANKTNSKISYISIGGSDGVLIPDEVLHEPGIAYAWLFLHTGENDGETKVIVTIPVIERASINTVEPTPTQRDAIDEAIEALDTAVSKCEESVAHYPKVVEGYWYVWDGEEGDFVNTDVSAHGEQGPQGPQGPAGQDGLDGRDGTDGNDGFSPIATVSKVGNTATISITDKNGTTTAEISDGNYENLIDDTISSSVKAWSSSKTSNELAGKMDKENPTGSGSLSIGRKEGSSSGNYSSAVGYEVIAEEKAAHAEGDSTIAFGIAAHAEGYATSAGGRYSHAEGYSTTANGYYSHAEGTNSKVYGDSSHAEGYDTIASGEAQHVFGRRNIEDRQGTYVEIVGNGTLYNRSNARTLDWEGNEILAGKLTINGTPTEPNDVARLQDVNRSFVNILNFPDALIPHGLHSNAVGWDMNKGQYLLHVICRYDSSTQGRRHMALANNPDDGTFYGSAYLTETDCAALGAEIVTLNMMTFVSIPADNSPVYVRAYQTNTRQESINMSVRVQYYKISD